ncbi:MAG: dTDP-4-dehydrorhamnose 3,5-epimerase [Pseudomonadota bacterium]
MHGMRADNDAITIIGRFQSFAADALRRVSTVFERTPISDLLLVRPKRYGDERGYFSETWSQRAFETEGLDYTWVQDNHSLSRAPGVLRGLHYQSPPMAQAKLVRCTAGRIWDVAVDMRPGSASMGQWFGAELSAENGAQVLVPAGFLHGFLTLSADAEVQYKVDAPYAPDCDGSVAWDDPELGIVWPLDEVEGGLVDGRPILSGKDASAPRVSEWANPFPAAGGEKA